MNMQQIRTQGSRGRRPSIASFAVAFFGLVLLAHVAPASAGSLDRVREAGKLTLGYRVDARPLSYQDESGKPAGYSVALCEKIAEEVKTELGLSTLNVEWVPVSGEERFRAVQEGRIDLLCGTEDATLARRKEVAFSIPIYLAGMGAVLREDAPRGLRNVLEGRKRILMIWRANPAEILEKQTFSVVAGSRGEQWLNSRLEKFQIDAKVVPVESYEAGVQAVLERKADVFFAEHNILLDAVKRSAAPEELNVLDRRFTYASLALAVPRGDEDFRLLADRTLSRLYGSAEFGSLYAQWFGEADEDTLKFFQMIALPE
jgi:putrescine:ornithine antiporter